MSDDLVKRLRAVFYADSDLLEEAADRIEKLEADLEDKEAECRYLRGECNMTKAKLAGLTG